jgi:hypothetical protein
LDESSDRSTAEIEAEEKEEEEQEFGLNDHEERICTNLE